MIRTILKITSTILILFLVFGFERLPQDELQLAIHQVNKDYQHSLNQFKKQLTEYKRISEAWRPEEQSLIELRQRHVQTRMAFKKIEYLIEYVDPAGVKQSINGAPLPKTEPKVSDLRIIQPKGLQTLDELVFADADEITKESLLKLINPLLAGFETMHKFQSSITLDHRQVFEAASLGLIRIFTLGVTGFDTPGSANALPEAHQALLSIHTDLQHYYNFLQSKEQETALALESTFLEALKYLELNTDFDSFDRLTFLKKYINPLLQLISQSQSAMEIESWKEVGILPPALNSEASNIFDENFLNKQYFSSLVQNEYTPLRSKLGEKLFYDAILSKDNNLSCASCHMPDKAFTDGRIKSIANDGKSTVMRNAPSLINAVYAEKYFYDLRESTFEKQMSHVIHDQLEFNTDFIQLIDELDAHPEYKMLIEEAYPNEKVSKHAITNSLANYVANLTSWNSPMDQYIRGEEVHISDAAKRGFNLFMGKGTCGTCHFAPTFAGLVPPLFQESESEVLGVPSSAEKTNIRIDPDWGRIANQKPLDEAEFYKFSFKTTSVRNISSTGPYMHNGVYKTLDEVVEFYNNGGGVGMGMELEYQTLPPDSLHLSVQEQSDLIAFMQSLDDPSIKNLVAKN